MFLTPSRAPSVQDAVLFAGTLRDSVDPFGEHDDAAVWAALDQCALGDTVRAWPEALLHPITEVI